MSDFDDLVDTSGLDPDEEARLRRVHELLVQAGPPAELPPSLAHPPEEAPAKPADVIPFPRTAARRMRAYGLVAAAAAAVVFGGGFLLGHSKAKQASFDTIRVVPMHGVGGSGSTASIRIAERDSVGNWPMLISVSGLPKQANPASYYELWLTRNGKAVAPCGGFRVRGGRTTVELSVPYSLKRFDGWVVTASLPGHRDPGAVVMTT